MTRSELAYFASVGVIVAMLTAVVSVFLIQLVAYSWQASTITNPQELNAYWASARFQMVRSATDLSFLWQITVAGVLASVVWIRLRERVNALGQCLLTYLCYFLVLPLYGLISAAVGGGHLSALSGRFVFVMLTILPPALVHWALMKRIRAFAEGISS